MNLFKQNGHWWVNFTDADGARRRKPTHVRVGGQAEALRATEEATRIVGLALAGAVVKVGTLAPTLGITLGRTYSDVWEGTKSAHIMRYTVARVSREIGHKPITEVTYEFLRDYCKGLVKEEYAHATINRRMSCVGVALREALRRGEITRKPDVPHYKEANTKDRYMTSEEEARVFDWLGRKGVVQALDPADGSEEWTFIHAFASLLIDTGLRFSEALKFTLVDGQAVVTDGKTKAATRRVPLTERAHVGALYLAGSPLYAELAADPRPKAAWDYVAHRWARVTRECRCPDVTLHILRHTCASRLVQRGVNLYVVKEWLGHSSVKVTERYAHLAQDSLSHALAALEGRPVGVPSSPSGEVTTCHATTPIRETL